MLYECHKRHKCWVLEKIKPWLFKGAKTSCVVMKCIINNVLTYQSCCVVSVIWCLIILYLINHMASHQSYNVSSIICCFINHIMSHLSCVLSIMQCLINHRVSHQSYSDSSIMVYYHSCGVLSIIWWFYINTSVKYLGNPRPRHRLAKQVLIIFEVIWCHLFVP